MHGTIKHYMYDCFSCADQHININLTYIDHFLKYKQSKIYKHTRVGIYCKINKNLQTFHFYVSKKLSSTRYFLKLEKRHSVKQNQLFLIIKYVFNINPQAWNFNQRIQKIFKKCKNLGKQQHLF